jgi:hypothetical protein
MSDDSAWRLVEAEAELQVGMQLLGLFCSNCQSSHVFTLARLEDTDEHGRWWRFAGTCLDVLPGNLVPAILNRRLFRRVPRSEITDPVERELEIA